MRLHAGGLAAAGGRIGGAEAGGGATRTRRANHGPPRRSPREALARGPRRLGVRLVMAFPSSSEPGGRRNKPRAHSQPSGLRHSIREGIFAVLGDSRVGHLIGDHRLVVLGPTQYPSADAFEVAGRAIVPSNPVMLRWRRRLHQQRLVPRPTAEASPGSSTLRHHEDPSTPRDPAPSSALYIPATPHRLARTTTTLTGLSSDARKCVLNYSHRTMP